MLYLAFVPRCLAFSNTFNTYRYVTGCREIKDLFCISVAYQLLSPDEQKRSLFATMKKHEFMDILSPSEVRLEFRWWCYVP